MKKSRKVALSVSALGFALLFTASCTANFCSDIDKSRILFAVEPGVSHYLDLSGTDEEIAAKKSEYETASNQGKEDGKKNTFYYEPAFGVGSTNTTLYRVVTKDFEGGYVKSNVLTTIVKSAKSNLGYQPLTEYFATIDKLVLKKAVEQYNIDFPTNPVQEATLNAEQANTVLTKCGYLKYHLNTDNEKPAIFDNYYTLHNQAVLELTAEKCPSRDFVNYYVQTLNQQIANNRSCISTFEVNDKGYVEYGKNTPDVEIQTKDWGYAWSKGFFEGLLVFPVAWLIDTFTQAFGGVSANGVNQLLALALVTLIVRLFIFACTFKSTLSQQKMQSLQPELAKIQAKYPNANTSQTEKQRLAQEQSALYKKHKINPLSQLLVMIIQFPVFICVWGAMTGATVLSRGTFLGLNLSTSIMSALSNVSTLPGNSGGWWTALVLIILMSVSQFLSMKLPQWIQKAKLKKVAKFGKNPAQTQQNKTMNIVSYVMLAFIIFMGFSLPAAMGVYWFLSALISLGISFLTQAIVGASSNKKGGKKHAKRK